MLIRTILKLPVILFFLKNSYEVFAQSLFDDLPQNGALQINSQQNMHNNYYQASDIQSERKILKPTLKHSSTNGNLRSILDSTTTRTTARTQRKIIPKQNISLFDSLPNQGALTLSAEQNPPRNTRDSVFTPLVTNPQLQQKISQDFILDSSGPLSKDDFNFFDTHLIPHIRHQVVSPTIVPVITGPTHVSSTTIPILPNKYNEGYGHRQYHTIGKDEFEDSSHSSSDSGKSYVSATAKSGGPTVIVYAHPHDKGSQNQNSEQGALPPAPPPERNNIPGRNEVHYHYHLPSSTTTTQSPYYASNPRSSNNHHSNHNNNNHHSNNNGHDSNNNNHHSNNNGHNSNNNNHHSNNNSHNSNNNNHHSNNNNNHHQNRPPPPSSQYGSPQPPPPTTRRPSSSGSYPSSRLNIAGISLTEEQNDNRKDFNHRTFFTPSKHQSSESYSPPSNDYSGWQTKTTSAPHSFTYESPPSLDAPQPPPAYFHDSSPSYAPPPNSNYGPPESSPPPAPQNDPPLPPAPAPPTESHQTSISYQTIPVTHQVTEFVQVPTITQTLINHSSPPPLADPPSGGGGGAPPSSAYGPPPNPGRTLNIQTAQSPSNARAADRSLIAEDQLNRLLLSSSPTSRENSLSDLLLLNQGQSGRGSNDLSLVELQLLAAASRGSGFSNNNFQNTNLNLFGGGRGRFTNSLPVVNSGFRTNGPLGGGNNLNSLAFANGGGVRNFGFQGSNFNGNQFANQQVTGTDTATAIHELIREQRIQGALNDLRGRLRDQNRGADRERQNYRNLFYKGALLLSALTLLPTVATPMAAAAAANSAASVIPSFMMPLTIGRRKRAVFENIPSFQNTELTPFEKCLEKIKNKHRIGGADLKRRYHSSFHQWLNCSNKLACQDRFAGKRTDLKNIYRIAHQNANFSEVDRIPQLPILKSDTIRDDLRKYLPIEDILLNSKCIQKYFCNNLLALKVASNDDKLLYSMFATDILNNNIWIKEAFEAAKQNMCNKFHCYEDEIK